jgi:hypothetical protein
LLLALPLSVGEAAEEALAPSDDRRRMSRTGARAGASDAAELSPLLVLLHVSMSRTRGMQLCGVLISTMALCLVKGRWMVRRHISVDHRAQGRKARQGKARHAPVGVGVQVVAGAVGVDGRVVEAEALREAVDDEAVVGGERGEVQLLGAGAHELQNLVLPLQHLLIFGCTV